MDKNKEEALSLIKQSIMDGFKKAKAIFSEETPEVSEVVETEIVSVTEEVIEEVKNEVVGEVKIEFNKTELEGGVIIYSDGEVVVGSKLYLDEAMGEVVPDAVHIDVNGNRITTVEGVVTEIVIKEEEVKEEVKEEEVIETSMAFKMDNMEKNLNEVWNLMKELQDLSIKNTERLLEFSKELKKPVKEEKSTIKKFSNDPVESKMEYIRNLQESLKK